MRDVFVNKIKRTFNKKIVTFTSVDNLKMESAVIKNYLKGSHTYFVPFKKCCITKELLKSTNKEHELNQKYMQTTSLR